MSLSYSCNSGSEYMIFHYILQVSDAFHLFVGNTVRYRYLYCICTFVYLHIYHFHLTCIGVQRIASVGEVM